MTDARRAAEIQHATGSLRAEWAYWRSQTSTKALEKHTTQIRAVAGLLDAGLDGVAGLSDPYERVLDLFHVGDFFRAKILLRLVEPVRPFLDAADELAWALYRPAVQAAGRRGEQLKEPPLVFLDRGIVPFAAARGSSYRTLLPRDIRTGSGAKAAAALPFPVIGVPWYLAGHLPGVLLVAHEVGHHLEDDCELTGELEQRLAGAGLDAARVPVWAPWLGEVFADVAGSLACGSAYARVLADALATTPADGAGGERYPPPSTRVAVCRAAVRAAGLPDDDLPAGFPDDLPASDPAGLPGDDVRAGEEAAAVATALVTGGYRGLGGKTLTGLLTHADTARVATGADRLTAGMSSDLHDARPILAAAALSFLRDPRSFDTRQVQSRAVAEVLAMRPQGPRGLDLADQGARAARDAAAGGALLQLFG
ncbi:hypothetical protein [Paractinoplanes maris]|uniref:hypothetical protein n=1 Tax=Paractinoplanes maris TaxID=1734446 RepID=UPI002021480F|nr:hypothetical protein [Actinoplanes maris]